MNATGLLAETLFAQVLAGLITKQYPDATVELLQSASGESMDRMRVTFKRATIIEVSLKFFEKPKNEQNSSV